MANHLLRSKSIGHHVQDLAGPLKFGRVPTLSREFEGGGRAKGFANLICMGASQTPLKYRYFAGVAPARPFYCWGDGYPCPAGIRGAFES